MAYGKTISKKNGYTLVAVLSETDPNEVIAFAILDSFGQEIDRYFKIVTASHAFESLIQTRLEDGPPIRIDSTNESLESSKP